MSRLTTITFKLILLALLICIIAIHTTTTSPSEKETSNQNQENTEVAQKTKLAQNNKISKKNSSIPIPNKEEQQKSVTAIGDSVMLGAASSLRKEIENSVIDAKECRQVSKGKKILEELNSSGRLRDTVIIALGTNGIFRESVGQEIIDYLGKDRTIYWVLVYGKHLKWMKEVNTTIRKLAKENKNVHIIDWEKEAASHSNWFYKDGIHLKAEGQRGYAEYISSVITK